MLERQLSTLVAAGLARAVSNADIRQAYDLIVNESQRTLGVDAVIVTRQSGRWAPVSGARTSSFASCVSDGPIPFHDDARVLLVSHAEGVATAVLLSTEGDVALLLDGDLADVGEALEQWSLILTYALKSSLADDGAKRADRLLLRSYAMARRLSRVGGADAVARRLVSDVAELLDAERVSLALYHDGEDCLTIAAAHGYPAATVESVRITPGEWVIGHVFSTRRPVIVRDVRTLAGAARADRYRSASFAAIPVVSGKDTIGVLSVTDKRDGTGLERHDVIVLRAFAVWAGIALASARIESAAERLAYAATIDSLTGLLNRTYFDSRLHQELERAKRENGTLALMIADIDAFKAINDQWGHREGDAVLRTVGSVIRGAVRVFDCCARYGGDEFAIVMPNATRESALGCAERIRRRLAEHHGGSGDEHPPVTMSIGVAVLGEGDTVTDLMVRADRCMYQAKAQGKNCVVSQPLATDLAAAESPVDSFPIPDRLLEAALAAPNTASSDDEPISYSDLPYVLVADGDGERAASCRESMEGSQLGLLVVRDGQQALRAIERFGPPAMLVVDLALSPGDAFEVIDTVRRDERRHPPIIAWASSRAMREYAAARLAGRDVRVLRDAASRAVIRAAIVHALRDDDDELPVPEPSTEPEGTQQWISELLNRARHLSGAPGIAVYVRTPPDARFRASYAWLSDDVMPHSPVHLPGAVERITQTGESILMNDIPVDLERELFHGADDGVRGLAGVPLISNREVVGALCVFDSRPLKIDEATLAALRAVGDDQFNINGMLLPAGRAVGFRDRATDRAASSADGNSESSMDWPPSLLERSGGEFAVARELARARREGHPLSVILFDLTAASPAPAIDDESLNGVTETLLRAIRQSDLPIRWSEGELLVVLPGLFNEQARGVAERVRAALQVGARHRVAVSGGVAELKAEERFGDVVGRARERVMVARSRGHNRVL